MVLTVGARVDAKDLGAFGPGEPSPLEHQVHLVWRLSQAVLFLQLGGMIVFTTVQYNRFDLTIDFANYSQAWSAIARGHLDPYSTLMGLSFWHNDLELLMWPLALFYWVYPHTVTLLWLQAFALVGSELVVLAWAKEALTRHGHLHPRSGPLLGLVTLLLILTPWSWFTLGFDFHLEPFATLFTLLAARELWAGRYKRLLLWVPLTLVSCAAAGSMYVMASGLAALLAKRGQRVRPSLVVIAGCSWLLFAKAIGGMHLAGNQALASGYGYLTNHSTSHITVFAILAGLASHPLRAFDMFASHAGYVAGYVASGGIIGLMSKWGALPAAAVLLPSALNASPLFIHFSSAFQSWAAVLFLIGGSALSLQRVSERELPRSFIAAFGSLTLVVSLTVCLIDARVIHGFADRLSPATTVQLVALEKRIPSGAEVIVSQGVIGRFATGRIAYYYYPIGTAERYTVGGAPNPVWFVLGPLGGQGEGDPTETLQAVSYLEHVHATLVTDHAGIWAFRWVPRGKTSLRLP